MTDGMHNCTPTEYARSLEVKLGNLIADLKDFPLTYSEYLELKKVWEKYE
jgi:hypothetical protein